MNKDMLPLLAKTPLFRDLTRDELSCLLDGIHTRRTCYNKGEVLLRQDDVYNALLFLVEGACLGEMVDKAGGAFKMADFAAPYVIAPGILFAKQNLLPLNIIAKGEVTALSLARADVSRVINADARVRDAFIQLVSEQVVFISKRLYFMSFHSIRGKIANYLLALPSQDTTAHTMRKTLPTTIEELATYFGVARPSLARVLAELERERVISREKKEVVILDEEGLRALLP